MIVASAMSALELPSLQHPRKQSATVGAFAYLVSCSWLRNYGLALISGNSSTERGCQTSVDSETFWCFIHIIVKLVSEITQKIVIESSNFTLALVLLPTRNRSTRLGHCLLVGSLRLWDMSCCAGYVSRNSCCVFPFCSSSLSPTPQGLAFSWY